MSGLISRLRAGGSILQVLIVSALVMAATAIAGASPGSMDANPIDPSGGEVSLTTSAETTPTGSPEPSESPTSEPSDDPDADAPESSDGSGDNHGTYVSKVARCVPPGPGHGEAVREMAQTHENEAAKADEICSRYGSSSPTPNEAGGEEASERGHAKDKGKPDKSQSPGKAGKKGGPSRAGR